MAAETPRSWAPSVRVGIFALVLGVSAGAAYVVWLWHWRQPLSPGYPVLALAGAFAAFEIFVVHLEYHHEAHSVSLSELALVAGLMFFPPWALLVARLGGSLVVLLVHRRQWNIKLPINLASFAVETMAATVIYRAVLSSHRVFSWPGTLAALAAVLVANIVGAILISGAVSLYELRLQRAMFREGVGIETLAALVTASGGVLACAVIWFAPTVSWLLVILAGFGCVGFREYACLRQRYSSLERLYRFTRSVGTSIDTAQAMEMLLSEAVELLRAEVSEITLFDASRATGLRSSAVDRRLQTVAVSLHVDTSLELLAAASASAVLAARLTKDHHLNRCLADRDHKDALVIPLQRNGSVIGTFLVANRLGHVTTFDAEDLKLFETIGLHASTTLENGRLVDQLRDEAASKEFQSLHDHLTGLPNRALFHRLVQTAINGHSDDARLAGIMLMDLDRFKEVNDTLGHHTGDLLLMELGKRLCRAVGERGHVARLGGDEFAILVPNITNRSEAEEVAKLILVTLEHPLALSGINLQVGASIGLAMFPEHASDSDSLLQLADVAMYEAKSGHSGYAVYANQRDNNDTRRLALAADLRAAIEQRVIVSFYQPITDVQSKQLIGVEALARWHHPRYGPVSPDEFIPIAEHTGLIRLLTENMLETALRQCRSWRQLGLYLSVAVNLSVRNLMDGDLPDVIQSLLSDLGLPAEVLTLEITEGTIMADPLRTLEVLHRLAAMGVTLAIDDFGTGYSSLAYLKRLPVHKVKIDQSFVRNMTSDNDDQVIVRSVVDLARNLRLEVVAEGVEDARTWDSLAALGCDSIQGYYISKPVEGSVLTRRLLTRGTHISQWVNQPSPLTQTADNGERLTRRGSTFPELETPRV